MATTTVEQNACLVLGAWVGEAGVTTAYFISLGSTRHKGQECERKD